MECGVAGARSAGIGDGSGRINLIIPFADVAIRGQELVMGGLQFLMEQSSEIGLGFGVAFEADQVFCLERVAFVIEQKPGSVQIAHVGIAERAKATKFAAALFAGPFAERCDAADQGGIVGRVFAALHVTAEIEAFDRVGDRDVAEPKEGRHNVFRVDERGELMRAAAQSVRPTDEQRDADRFVKRFLFVPQVVRAEHVTMIGGEDHDGVTLETGLAKRLQQIADAPVEGRAMGVITGEIAASLFLGGGRHVRAKPQL